MSFEVKSIHVSVLTQELISGVTSLSLDLNQGGVFLDCTLGGGGHTRALLENFKQYPKINILALDRDPAAIQRAEKNFENEVHKGQLILAHQPFSKFEEILDSKIGKGAQLLGVIADLGVSSDQLENPTYGMSFLRGSNLDMRMDRTSGPTCYEVLQDVSQEELEDILRNYGEEKFWRRISQRIIDARHQKALPETTDQLSKLIVQAIPPKFRHQKIHAATRTFQALRIAVNQEFQELASLLERVIMRLVPGGRVGVISFHSLEDRVVKREFANRERWIRLTKKPVIASLEESQQNPRARSAKLRIAEKK